MVPSDSAAPSDDVMTNVNANVEQAEKKKETPFTDKMKGIVAGSRDTTHRDKTRIQCHRFYLVVSRRTQL